MRILYISTSFTALSHTFITREIEQLRLLGAEIELLSLREPATTAAERPECRLDGCRQAYPAPLGESVGGILRQLGRDPSALLATAARLAASRGDGPRQRLKLLYQLAVAARLADWVRGRGVDHIHAHFAGSPATFALCLGRLADLPFTFTDHGSGVFNQRIGLHPKLDLAAGIVAISRYNSDLYGRLHPNPPPHRVVRCGVQVDEFPFRRRAELGRPLEILAVGRLVPKKGFRHLLAALALLRAQGLTWRGRLVGEGPLESKLRAQARELGLEDLEFTGPLQQAEVRRLMQAADLFVAPSVVTPDGDMDGIPVTIMEAMACGLPVISTRVSGIPELVQHERTGLLTDPGDEVGLATAMMRLAAAPDLVASLSEGGRRWVAEEFDVRVSARRLLEFFQQVATPGALASR